MTEEEKEHATAKDKEKAPGGPVYKTAGAPLADYKNWQQDGVDDTHKCIIQAIAGNEGWNHTGDLAGVQSYDKAVLSAGAMQKTIFPEKPKVTGGTGELADQLADFKSANPTKYKSLFEDKGWTVSQVNGSNVAYFKDPNNPKMQPITGSALQNYIRQCDGANWEKTMKPWRDAGKDPDFQSQQILDFHQRIEDTQNKKVKVGKTDFKIKDFITSSRGIAQITDQSVNSGPGSIKLTVRRAITEFYKQNPKASSDPTTWTDEQRGQYEPQILDLYHSKRTGMTDGEKRWKKIQSSSCLSDDPGSMS
ncbi:MAG TPA: hypothetical protein VFB79_07390 [Candidatus Angelobacter sp.]|nr:hypothetical protein [Candidatus Angelobacter sp.]